MLIATCSIGGVNLPDTGVQQISDDSRFDAFRRDVREGWRQSKELDKARNRTGLLEWTR